VRRGSGQRYCPVELHYGPLSLACVREDGHDGAHLATGVGWTDTSAAAAAASEPPTQRMAPIRDTVLRRPPAVEVRELRGPELLRALADELDREGLDGEQL
jgi:hypothetical protein